MFFVSSQLRLWENSRQESRVARFYYYTDIGVVWCMSVLKSRHTSVCSINWPLSTVVIYRTHRMIEASNPDQPEPFLDEWRLHLNADGRRAGRRRVVGRRWIAAAAYRRRPFEAHNLATSVARPPIADSDRHDLARLAPATASNQSAQINGHLLRLYWMTSSIGNHGSAPRCSLKNKKQRRRKMSRVKHHHQQQHQKKKKNWWLIDSMIYCVPLTFLL